MSSVADIVVTATTQTMLGGVVETISYERQVGARPTCHIPTDHPGGNVTTGNRSCGASTED